MLKEAGIGGACDLGNTSEPLCQIRVALNLSVLWNWVRLNPVAAAVVAGIEMENIAESGVIDFEQLHNVWEL